MVIQRVKQKLWQLKARAEKMRTKRAAESWVTRTLSDFLPYEERKGIIEGVHGVIDHLDDPDMHRNRERIGGIAQEVKEIAERIHWDALGERERKHYAEQLAKLVVLGGLADPEITLKAIKKVKNVMGKDHPSMIALLSLLAAPLNRAVQRVQSETMDVKTKKGLVHFHLSAYGATAKSIMRFVEAADRRDLQRMLADINGLKKRLYRIQTDRIKIEGVLQDWRREYAVELVKQFSSKERGIIHPEKKPEEMTEEELKAELRKAERALIRIQELREAEHSELQRKVDRIPELREITDEISRASLRENLKAIHGEERKPSRYELWFAALDPDIRFKIKEDMRKVDGAVALQRLLEHLKDEEMLKTYIKTKNRDMLREILTAISPKHTEKIVRALSTFGNEAVARLYTTMENATKKHGPKMSPLVEEELVKELKALLKATSKEK